MPPPSPNNIDIIKYLVDIINPKKEIEVAKTFSNAVLGFQKSSIYAGFRRFSDHSHSTVAGGLDVISYTTRLTPLTSLVMRAEAFASSS